jgi:hypothetical protein
MNKKMTNVIQINKWLNYKIDIENQLLTNRLIKKSLNLFYKQIFSNLKDDQFILIQFKIKELSGEFKSISYIQRINKNEFKTLLKIFIEFWNIKSEEYHSIKVSSIVYTYKILSSELKISQSKITYHKNRINKFLSRENKISRFKFNGYNLPCTMDLTK